LSEKLLELSISESRINVNFCIICLLYISNMEAYKQHNLHFKKKHTQTMTYLATVVHHKKMDSPHLWRPISGSSRPQCSEHSSFSFWLNFSDVLQHVLW
jgi:hypothetical protein